MRRFYIAVFAVFVTLSQNVQAQQTNPTLAADPMLIDSGFLKFLLPRFSLKTSVRINLRPLGETQNPDMVLRRNRPADGTGKPALRMGELVFYISGVNPGPNAQRFVDWLLSDIGQRTIAQFTPESGAGYVGAANEQVAAPVVVLSGNAANGEKLSFDKCGRCHVIGPRNRLKGIGSTPSFALLRSLDDWLLRFNEFYVRIPHPSFSQVTGVTPPFDPGRPPPISPLRLSMQDLDDIIAYTNTIEPADLGAPLVVHQ